MNSSYYYQNPYPFWFGYPGWYASPLWYPSAWWYGTGFYFGLGGNMILFGLPSIGFSNWFFTRGYTAYPHLYNRFNTYYTRNIGEHRFWTPGNSDFMWAAHWTFGPSNGLTRGRANWLTNARLYGRPGSWAGANGRIATPLNHYQNMNAGAYHTQAWGRGFCSMHSIGSGSFHSGSFHGGATSTGAVDKGLNRSIFS